MILRDGSFSAHTQLGALPPLSNGKAIQFPPLELPRMATKTSRPRSQLWECRTRNYQGPYGSCFPNAFAHSLAATPKVVLISRPRILKIYFGIQLTDGLPGGEYVGAQPIQGGTRGPDNIAAFRQAGYITGVQQVTTFDQLVKGIGYVGTPVIAVTWYEGMMHTDRNGFVHPTGKIVGRHAFCGLGVDTKQQVIIGLNSFYRAPQADGTGEIPWGDRGVFKLSYADMGFLMRDNSEAYFLTGQRQP